MRPSFRFFSSCDIIVLTNEVRTVSFRARLEKLRSSLLIINNILVTGVPNFVVSLVVVLVETSRC